MDVVPWSAIRYTTNEDIERRYRSIMRRIVEDKEHIDAQDSDDRTALYYVARYYSQSQSPDMPGLKSLEDALDLPLNSASALAIARLLLANGAQVDPGNRYSRTPLHIAAELNNLNMASLLLEYGADVNSYQDEFAMPLHDVASFASANMVQLLLAKGAHINGKDCSGRTALHCAVENDRLTVVPILLKLGADISSTDEELQTALHTANSPRMAELLIMNGAKLDAKDRGGSTPLHLASRSDLPEVVLVLAKFGANVNATDDDGQTAFHQIVESGSIDIPRETIRLLVRLGLNVLAENNEGHTAIQVAARSGRARAFLDLNVEVFPRTSRNEGIETDFYGGIVISLGGLIAASVALKIAGLSYTRDNLEAFVGTSYSRATTYSDIGDNTDSYKLKCEAEVEKMKNHMSTETMSLYDFMLTDDVHCLTSEYLLGSYQVLDCWKYPIYAPFLIIKFKKLELMVSAIKGFNVLLEAGGTIVRHLPENLVARILVHQGEVDLCNLIICSSSVIKH